MLVLVFCCMIFNMYSSNLLIKDIEVRGNVEVSESFVLNSLKIKIGDEFSFSSLTENYVSLRELDLFDNVKLIPKIFDEGVNILIDVVEKNNVADLLKNRNILTLPEINKRVKVPIISKLRINGNYNIEDEDIMSKITVGIGSEYSLDSLEIAKNNLLRMGTFRSVEYTSFLEKSKVEVTFHIDENNFVGSKIDVEGNFSVDRAEILKVITVEKNSILNVYKLMESQKNIEKLYLLQDISDITVEPIFKGSKLIFKISESRIGNIYFIKESFFGGDSSLETKDYVLRRNINLVEGEIIRKSDLIKSIYSLSRLGLFKSSITYSVKNNPLNSNLKDIYFKLEEDTGLRLKLNMGGNLGGDLKIEVGFQDNNFLNRAYKLNLSFDYTTSEVWKGKLSFYDPWVYGTKNLSYGIDLYRTNENVDVCFSDYFNNQIESGIGLKGGLPIFNNNTRLSLNLDFKNISQYSLATGNILDEYSEGIVALILGYNNTNSYTDPTSGFLFSIKGSYVKRFKTFNIEYTNFDKKSDIITSETDVRGYIPIFGSANNLAIRFKAGYARFLNDVKFARFRIGGSTSVRGYTSSRSGNVFGLLNTECRFVIYDEDLKVELALFLDIGLATFSDNMKDFLNIEEYKKSVGLEFRLKKFIVPLSVSFAIPLDSKSNGYIVPKFNFGFTF